MRLTAIEKDWNELKDNLNWNNIFGDFSIYYSFHICYINVVGKCNIELLLNFMEKWGIEKNFSASDGKMFLLLTETANEFIDLIAKQLEKYN